MSEDDLMTCKPARHCRFLGLILILPWLFPPSATSPLLLAAKVCVYREDSVVGN
ncbi:unnamed protein product, partial [Vitis vinifera]